MAHGHGGVGAPFRPTWLVPALAGAGLVNGWLLWMVLRGPVRPRAETLPPGVAWARRLLYANVLVELLLWRLLGGVAAVPVDVVTVLVGTVTLVQLVRGVSGGSRTFKLVAVGLALIGALSYLAAGGSRAAGLGLLGLVAGLAALASVLMILLAQRRDGRWSDATIGFGRIAAIAPLLLPLLSVALFARFAVGVMALEAALSMFSPVWLARTAHELAAPAGRTAEKDAEEVAEENGGRAG